MSDVTPLRTPTEQQLAASVSLAEIRSELRTLAADLEDDVDNSYAPRGALMDAAERVRHIDELVHRFGEQARALIASRP